MRLIKSRQRNVKFSYCPSPVTIDKSSEWGEGNIQKFPNGVFFKHDDLTDTVTHGVQPCSSDQSKPEGWEHEVDEDGSVLGKTFRKNDIFLIKELEVGTIEAVETLDGTMEMDIKNPSSLVCQSENGEPNKGDSWVIENEELKKLYDI